MNETLSYKKDTFPLEFCKCHEAPWCYCYITNAITNNDFFKSTNLCNINYFAESITSYKYTKF